MPPCPEFVLKTHLASRAPVGDDVLDVLRDEVGKWHEEFPGMMPAPTPAWRTFYARQTPERVRGHRPPTKAAAGMNRSCPVPNRTRTPSLVHWVEVTGWSAASAKFTSMKWP
ncbi:hypothetical protein SAMN05421869_1082 [Nonomuraea jiangxiensis]|uniref:Uncharacterized protein n=1 Tax=Nonomuraea jiangxiensis TaxID=633440 RepID=A0A1G8PR44_9ACTN|nr:hypothetical protein SAMN05421869_1082 [Nonomuraea jiangxiensis]